MLKRQILILLIMHIFCIVGVIGLILFGLQLLSEILSEALSETLNEEVVNPKEKSFYYIQQTETSSYYIRQTETPSTYTENYEDLYLLAQIIHAEAKGEPYEGKLAVGNVIHNRVKSEQFPDSIRNVIFQKGQFQPVMNGSIYNEPSEESIRAARESYHTNIVGPALYFYNPELSTDTWITTRKTVKRIGNHVFAY